MTYRIWAAPPNVVVILADDMGFSDLGCYGSEIETPNFDRLAHGGLRFTQGYNTARCWPTRGALLTGYYAQSIRRDKMPGVQGGNRGGRPAWAQLLPERLAAAGYRSYHSGKWHVDGNPLEQGFSHSLDITSGGQNDFFDPLGITVDGKPIEEKDHFYVTTAVGEHAAACLREHAEHHRDKPFFSYVAFTSPHFPLHAPQDIIEKYKQRYQAGWNVMQQARYKRLVQSGIINAPLAAMEEDLGPPYEFPDALEKLGSGEVNRPLPWQSLTPEQQAFQATKMAIHAAMIDAMDQAVGEVIQQLEAMDALNDTLILCLSDNGGSAEIMVRGKGHDPHLPAGSAGTYFCLGPGWSSCANTPFRRHKTWVHEGGISTSWIVHWPAGIPSKSALREQPVHVIDIVPTVLELAGVEQSEEHSGEAEPPLQGRSFVECLTNPDAPPPHETLWWCHNEHRAVRHNDWKLVAARDEPWELYDLSSDRTEQNNLASSHPKQVKQLEKDWNEIATDNQRLADLDGKNKPQGKPKKKKPTPKKQAASNVDHKHDAQEGGPRQSPPNVVIIFTDDMGYADPACYGGTFAATPHIDRLAREGIKLTDFHVAQPVCSASRAALLTGCYPNRIGIHGALSPRVTHGLSGEETTLAELLRSRGYQTSMVGKWHLGHHRQFLPTRHGFDEYFGLPYSNDMWPYHPSAKPGTYPPLPLFENEEVIDAEVSPEDQTTLTKRYAQRAVDFLKRAGTDKDGRPFFLYLAHSMPHVPLFASNSFQGKAAGGLYGDVVAEIDASVGSVLTALEETGHLDDTLVLFTSDNGPWLSYGNHAGSAGSFREGKGTTFEGGVRVPCVARLPGVIPAGTVSDESLMTIDLLPSLAQLTGQPLKTDAEGHCIVRGKKIDGHDHLDLFCGGTRAADAPDTYHYYYRKNELQAVRKGDWKLFFPHGYRTMQGQELGQDGKPGRYTQHKIGEELFNLSTDPHETKDVAKQYPKVVEQLQAIAEKTRADLGDSLTKRKGNGARSPGQLSKQNGSKANPSKSAEKQKVIPARMVSQTPTPSGRRPNILFIIVDDQSPFDFKFYNPSSTLHAPCIEKLAREGMVFDAAYHMGAFSGAVCTPSRHMVMCGRTVWHLPIGPKKARREEGKPRQPYVAPHCPPGLESNTLAAVFNRAGYDTMRTCKRGNSYEKANQQFTVRNDATKRGGTAETGSQWHGDQVINFLTDREKSEDEDPFLIYFGLSHPHDTRDGTPQYLAKYGSTNHTDKKELPASHAKQPPVPSNWLPHHPFDNTHMDVRDEVSVSGVWGNRDTQTIRNEIGREYACSENIDAQVKRVLEKLTAMGELENTWIFYTSDHGIAIGRHGLQGKQNLYEHTWRVPLIVKGPGVRPGSRMPGNTYLGDTLATLCAITGVTPPSTDEGKSFLPVLEEKTETVRDVLYGVYCGGQKPGMRSVRKGDWKLIKYESPSGGLHTQLFNIQENPHEFLAEHHDPTVLKSLPEQPTAKQKNLADDPEFATTRSAMESLLLEEMIQHDDPYRFSDQPMKDN
jgi:arylsulfatase A-like enzyme